MMRGQQPARLLATCMLKCKQTDTAGLQASLGLLCVWTLQHLLFAADSLLLWLLHHACNRTWLTPRGCIPTETHTVVSHLDAALCWP